ncbi:TIM-barrel domain-containing protein [Photobacterium lutimaris]|uniref:PA14 domain-containing protein n=1 Tax=Photobacterium lutimaris TaxID=388278 RepID=A0A2T3IY55_9GAMM|nr:TIM-barrel domain-containing protein [Photobacterium lutimaris]PSU33528.1 hypothetical protein C9I99_12165 [Photobacterium lutimaris]TDR74637.1 alpha-D-xyloside xylohydrolase [Photobacterium lutimaris]
MSISMTPTYRYIAPNIIHVSRGVPTESLFVKEQNTYESEERRITVQQDNNQLTFSVDGHAPFLSEITAQAHSAVSQVFVSADTSPLFGLGQHPEGVYNWRNQKVRMCQSNKRISVPFIMSADGWGILWDSSSVTHFESEQERISFSSDGGQGISYYVICGPEWDQIIHGYRLLTGDAPLFARSAYGYWQSKERYCDRNEVEAVASEFRARKLPIDNLVQDWKYWGENPWSSMLVDEAVFPDLAGMITDMENKQNINLMFSIWPVIGDNCPLSDELDDHGHLFDCPHWSNGRFYDPYSQEAQDIYWKHLKAGLVDQGAFYMWTDGTEPELISSIWTEEESLEAAYLQKDTAAGPWREVANAYSLVHVKGLYERLRKERNDKRVFILSRSSYAGQQHYGGAAWSGDISSSWQVLREQIPAGLNYCASGLPYWATDIGGFFTSGFGANFPDGCKDNAYRELYVRWFQYGAFCPIFRSHGTGTPREVWQFGEPGDWAYDTIEQYLNLRYRLLPYIYSEAWSVTNNGSTMMRALPFDFRKDTTAHDIDDQFMFGQSLLVAPMTKPVTHQPVCDWMPVETKQMTTPDGQPGLLVEFFDGTNFETLKNSQVHTQVDYNWSGAAPEGVRNVDYTIRWTTDLTVGQDGEYEICVRCTNGTRLFVDGEIIIDSWEEGAEYERICKLDFTANTSKRVVLEFLHTSGPSKMSLYTRPPKGVAFGEVLVEPKREVYLPESQGWWNFWTGEFYTGSQTIIEDCPIEHLPLFVKAGSIIPFGPYVQYHDEKPLDDLELRIYTGDNATFTLYEDSGDGYQYEDKEYTEIVFSWDDKNGELTVSDIIGSFKGQLESRTCKVYLSNSPDGGMDLDRAPDAVFEYTGKRHSVKL